MMTENLEPYRPDGKTTASANASLEKCWSEIESPLPYIPIVLPSIEVQKSRFFDYGEEWYTGSTCDALYD